MATETTSPARAGRERTCTQCGATYRSPRNSSRYCSNACRMKAKRGTAPKAGPKAGPENFSMIGKVLHVAGFVGRIGPAFDREKSPPVYALLTDADAAFAELAAHFDRKGWGIVTRAEFDATLRNRYQARHRAALSRAA